MGRGGGGVRLARGSAHARPYLDRASGARGRARLPRGARRALLRLRAGTSPVGRDRPGGGLAQPADADRRGRSRRSKLRLLPRGDDRLRGHRRVRRPAAGPLASGRAHPGAARRAARYCRRARVRDLRRRDKGALGGSRQRAGRSTQSLERGHRHSGGLLVLRLRSQPPDRGRRRGDRRHLGRGEPVDHPRRPGGLRRPARRRPTGR